MFRALLSFIIFTAAVLIFFPLAWAETRTVTAEHKYVLGDNDSKNEARRICFLEAKRKVLEKAGTYVEVRTDLTAFALSGDEVRTFAGASMRVEVLEEDFFVVGESFAVRVKVKADVDMDSLKDRLRSVAADPSALRKISEGVKREYELEDRVLGLQRRISKEEYMDVLKAKSEQRQIFNTLDEIQEEKDKILSGMARQSKLAFDVVEVGMTVEEVVRLLGQPRARKENTNMSSTYLCFNYGRVWVVFRDGLTACLRERLVYRERYKSDCHCSGLTGNVFTR
ncbi:MAG: hypothetical protein SVS15_04240 [Thermodesulfobacteriota bacterium]|nr:hypothetical protein [Thermodesulfobacteriota bacterium]